MHLCLLRKKRDKLFSAKNSHNFPFPKISKLNLYLTGVAICITLYYSVRSVINISLPKQLESIVTEVVARGHFSSKSEFFRHLLRNYIENDLVRDLEKSRKELGAGGGKLLTSLKDLR